MENLDDEKQKQEMVETLNWIEFCNRFFEEKGGIAEDLKWSHDSLPIDRLFSDEKITEKTGENP